MKNENCFRSSLFFNTYKTYCYPLFLLDVFFVYLDLCPWGKEIQVYLVKSTVPISLPFFIGRWLWQIEASELKALPT